MANETTGADLRAKTDAELAEQLKTAQGALFTARFENFTNKLDDTAKMRRLRREIARIKTVQTERKRSAAAKKAEG
ncbi:MAG: 50S ribosomal protein L29 [Myxococcales bacterium]|nr:50S ribosomal protein L29 [Myxococcales bacterium]